MFVNGISTSGENRRRGTIGCVDLPDDTGTQGLSYLDVAVVIRLDKTPDKIRVV